MRKQIGKSLRFSIFARDGFTCRYCGRQSDTVVLEVDHLIPVSNGGTNDPENLLTSCRDCNAGKSAKNLDTFAPNETDRLRLAQERHEQIKSAEDAREAMLARKKIRQLIANFWMDLSGRGTMDNSTHSVMCSFVDKHGVRPVMEWIEKAHARLPNSKDKDIGRYVSGIRRTLIKTGEIQEQ